MIRTSWARAWVFVLLCGTSAHGGPVVRGTVRDADSGQGLAAATLQVEGTYRGTIVNDAGDYALEVETLPATLRVTHIGYASQARTVTDTADLRIDFDLAVAPYRLPEIVVTPTLAADLMRKVIARKAEWRPRLTSYRAEAYTRRTIDRTGDIIEVHEIVSDVFWDRERGSREVITSVRKTANASDDGDLEGALEGTADLYADDIEFIESSLMGVTHPEALEHYRFELQGRRVVDDRVVYDISVRPRSRLLSGFEGTVAVLDEAFVLLEVDLRPTRATLATAVPIPVIEGLTWRYRQQFRDFGGIWLPVDYRLDVGVEVGMVGFHLPLIGLQQVTRFADYDVDASVPDSLFEPVEGRSWSTVRVDSQAVAADTAFTRFADPVPLSVAEQAALDTITAAYTAEKVLRPSGFLVRFMDFDDEEEEAPKTGTQVSAGVGADGATASARTSGYRRLRSAAEWQLGGRFNRVESISLSLQGERAGPAGTRLRARTGYSSGLERLSARVGVRRAWTDGAERGWHVDVDGRRGADSRYAAAAWAVWAPTALVLRGEDGSFDYYGNEGITVEVGVDPKRWQTTASLAFRAEDHGSLSSTTDDDLLGRAPLRPNPAVDDGHMRRLELRLAAGDPYHRFGVVPNRRLEVQVEHSGGWMGSDFDYTRFHVEAEGHLITFLRRRWVPNALDVRAAAGTHTGDLPVQRFGAVDVAMGPVSPWGVLRGAHGHPYVGQRYVSLLAEHNFRTVPFEMLGLWPLVRRGFGLVVFGGYGQTWIDAERRAAMVDVPRWTRTAHTEAGVSLLLYNLFRADLTRRLDSGGAWSVGVGMARFEFD